MQSTIYSIISRCITHLIRPFLTIIHYCKNLFTHASSHRKVRHPWLPADIFDVIPEEKIHNIPNQEILGDIRSILWPEKYKKIGNSIVWRDPITGRMCSSKKTNA